jgi:hypothetical protein
MGGNMLVGAWPLAVRIGTSGICPLFIVVTGPGHAIRLSRWSPTRMAFAMAVSALFAAPMLGKKSDAREETCVADVQVVDLVRLAVDVEHGDSVPPPAPVPTIITS